MSRGDEKTTREKPERERERERGARRGKSHLLALLLFTLTPEPSASLEARRPFRPSDRDFAGTAACFIDTAAAAAAELVDAEEANASVVECE